MPRTLPGSPDSPFPRVLVSHAGLGCADLKRAVFPAGIGHPVPAQVPAARKLGRRER